MITSRSLALSIEDINFQVWEDADTHVVNKIFSFSEQCGNESLMETVAICMGDKQILDNLYLSEFSCIVNDEISMLKSLIDYYLEANMEDIDPAYMRDRFKSVKTDAMFANQYIFLLASHCAIKLFNSLIDNPKYNSFINVWMDKELIAKTVARKQRDYGPNNVSKFGLYGLIVRLHDKIARLENLLSSKRNGVNSVKDETIYDTLLDIVGYSTISIMWINDWFLLPMSVDQ